MISFRERSRARKAEKEERAALLQELRDLDEESYSLRRRRRYYLSEPDYAALTERRSEKTLEELREAAAAAHQDVAHESLVTKEYEDQRTEEAAEQAAQRLRTWASWSSRWSELDLKSIENIVYELRYSKNVWRRAQEAGKLTSDLESFTVEGFTAEFHHALRLPEVRRRVQLDLVQKVLSAADPRVDSLRKEWAALLEDHLRHEVLVQLRSPLELEHAALLAGSSSVLYRVPLVALSHEPFTRRVAIHPATDLTEADLEVIGTLVGDGTQMPLAQAIDAAIALR